MDSYDYSSLSFLKQCLHEEVIKPTGDKGFTWLRVIDRCRRYPKVRYNFWWRVAGHLYLSKYKFLNARANKLQCKLISKYHMDIELGAKIAPGLKFHHFASVVITKNATIGRDFNCYQNTTIGWRKDPYSIKIGNNVTLGCGATILGGEISVGDNVKIGAMTLILESIPSDCTIVKEVKNKMIRMPQN